MTFKDTKKVFNLPKGFEAYALEVFKLQSEKCLPYKKFIENLRINPAEIKTSDEIPFMPVGFFKEFEIITGIEKPEVIFESSSTGKQGVSRHFVTDLSLYEESFSLCFENSFGLPANYCHLALLPGYLERKTSSLVYQVNGLMQTSQFKGDFYLNDYKALSEKLTYNEKHKIKTILWGVSFALWDLADKFPQKLNHTTIIETGGMKGKRTEITREELHNIIKDAFGINSVASEYGMTELLSQGYSTGNGVFKCPPWMKVIPRDINDPLSKRPFGQTCGLNIIDLANINSCSFIETSDLGRVYADGNFEVLGRFDHSETRGCNLMVP
ncbi:MAG: acyl transferase [Bacteroidia bacterium]|nr:acyl transferase [Bacteroidia bacterium]